MDHKNHDGSTSGDARDASGDGCGNAKQKKKMQEMKQVRQSWLTHAVAVLLMVFTFCLIAVGGNVTSLDAGLAVPDGWTTFGYWTPIAPLSVWWGDMGARWEHGHRLFGNLVGILSIALVIMAFWKQRERKWFCWLSVVLLGMIVVQGTMGVYRVTELSTGLALVHGVFGQIVLGMCVLMVAATGNVWVDLAGRIKTKRDGAEMAGGVMKTLRGMAIGLVVVLLIQLVLGASVRHTKSALAIPDFPLMYGQVVPPLTQSGVDMKTAEMNLRPYGVGQVWLQFGHRMVAFGIFIYGILFFVKLMKQAQRRWELIGPTFAMINMLLLQVILGVLVIWTNDYPFNATLHQAAGAALLGVCVWLLIRVYLVSATGGVEVETSRKTAGGETGGQVA